MHLEERKIILYLFIFISLIISPLQKINSQTAAYEYDVDQFVYWFHIKADIKPQKVTSRPVYVIRLSDDKPRHGSVYDYEHDLWKQINEGNSMPIGPFLDYYDALYAMQMYKLQNQLDEGVQIDESILKDIKLKSEYFWYFLTFKIKERKKSYSLKRIPAAVASGGVHQFKKVLLEGLSWQKLAIGPFPSQTEAEESKRLNRLEEDE